MSPCKVFLVSQFFQQDQAERVYCMGRLVGGSLFALGTVLYVGGTFVVGLAFLLLVCFQILPRDLDVGIVWILTTLGWWGIAVILMILGSLSRRNREKVTEA
jgi:hypothetical protein